MTFNTNFLVIFMLVAFVFCPVEVFAKKKDTDSYHIRTLIQKARQLDKDFDYTGAVENLTRASELGSPIAMNNLATYYETGLGVAKNEARAVELYRQAADGGDPYAMLNLGLAYRYGRLGVEQDEKKAKAILKKAASGGVEGAKQELTNNAREPGQREIREAREAEKRHDFEAAAALYRLAADKGNTFAMGQMGDVHFSGIGAMQNYGLAHDWYLKAAQKGDDWNRGWAMEYLGKIYRSGLGRDIDQKVAQKWLKKADKKDSFGASLLLDKGPESPLSDAALARNRSDQAAASGDFAAAIAGWEIDAASGDLNARYNLGWAFQHGLGVAADSTKAIQHYKQAATAGHRSALRAITRLAEHGDHELMVDVAEAYLAGKAVEQDGWLGREWLLRAEHLGNMQAATRLQEISPMPSGGGREEWEEGLKLNFSHPVRSREWYVKAASKGHIPATSAMGDSYVNGTGVAQDYELARLWFSRAARAGNAYAQQNYAALLVEGLGGPQDTVSAVFWFQRAAEQENRMAAWALGRMYSAGTGVPKDEAMAIHWFEVAADMGSVNADRELINRGIRPDVWKESVKKAREEAIQAKNERKESSSSLFSDLSRIWAYTIAPSASIDAMNSGSGSGISDAEWWAKSRARSECLRRVTESVQRATYGGQSWRYVDNC